MSDQPAPSALDIPPLPVADAPETPDPHELDKDALALLGIVVIIVGALAYAGLTATKLDVVGEFIAPVITGLFAISRGRSQ